MKLEHSFWGYRRVRAFMKRYHNISISYNKVFRSMKQNNLLVEQKRYKAKRTPRKGKPHPTKINQWWGTDMNKFYINNFGWIYLVIVLDWFTKKIVGYNLNVRSKSED
ncbi:MAG: IS3 family transposase [bacterium]